MLENITTIACVAPFWEGQLRLTNMSLTERCHRLSILWGDGWHQSSKTSLMLTACPIQMRKLRLRDTEPHDQAPAVSIPLVPAPTKTCSIHDDSFYVPT